jgi:putative zinc finger protein
VVASSGLICMATTWRRLNSRRDHRWARSRVSDYLDRELPPREQRRLAFHEELCPECARLIGSLEILLAILPSLRLPPGTSFEIAERTAERVRAQIGEWQ